MPETVVEGRLRMDFAEGWQALKFDASPWYRDVIGSRVKAVDLVAWQTGTHWWIEIKDCAGFEADNLPRLSPVDPPAVATVRQWTQSQGHARDVQVRRAKPFIVDEVAEKIEGTLVSVAAAARAGMVDQKAREIQPLAEVMNSGIGWNIVLLLAWSPTDFNRLAMRLRDKLIARLAAYNVQCFVLNEGGSAPQQPWTVTRTNP